MLFILSIFLPVTISTQCMLTPDNENVLRTQLAGNWQINWDLTAQLRPDLMDDFRISFTDDPSTLDMWPEEDCEYIMNNSVPLFLAGMMNITSTSMEEGTVTYPYILTDGPFIVILSSDG